MFGLFAILFGVVSTICAVQYFLQRRTQDLVVSNEFKAFYRNYVAVYLLAMGADWLQGPYVYALYQHYKFSQQEIGVLFIFGFASSALFGTFAGSIADQWGRKRSCLLYAVLYSLSCITKHFGNFWVLLLGRLLGGVATSLLFSCFESWLISEHKKRAFPAEWLDQIFSTCVFGNSIVAVTAGQIANLFVDIFGLVAPFDLAIVLLVVMAGIIAYSWPENRGTDSEVVKDDTSSVRKAIIAFSSNPKIMLLGAVQSCFEGAMYIFVFMWTPRLEKGYSDLPHGQVFACFMVCVMIGSGFVKQLTSRSTPEKYLVFIFGLAAASMLLPSMMVSFMLTVICFFLFECCCGIFWPSISIMRSKHVPEEIRSTVMNLYRVPLNIIVVSVLANLSNLTEDVVFMICGFLLVVATVSQTVFERALRAEQPRSSESEMQGLVEESGQ